MLFCMRTDTAYIATDLPTAASPTATSLIDRMRSETKSNVLNRRSPKELCETCRHKGAPGQNFNSSTECRLRQDALSREFSESPFQPSRIILGALLQQQQSLFSCPTLVQGLRQYAIH